MLAVTLDNGRVILAHGFISDLLEDDVKTSQMVYLTDLDDHACLISMAHIVIIADYATIDDFKNDMKMETLTTLVGGGANV